MWSLITLPFRIIGSLLSVAWNVVWGAVSLAFGLVGGILSLVAGAAVIVLVIGLISTMVKKHKTSESAPDAQENFSSFYQDKSSSVK